MRPELDVEKDGRIVASLSSAALLNNFEAIQALTPSHAVLPMIKANAYGHGAAWAARQLYKLPGLYALGVATLEEGKELREAIGPRGRKVRIVIFTGTVPWTEEKGQYCEGYHLSPVIQTFEDWNLFLRGGWAERLPYELMFNTGMNRLGLEPNQAATVAKALRNRPAESHPQGVLSHMAMGESTSARVSRTQLARFTRVRADLASALPATLFHLANSATIWNRKQFGLDGMTDVVRPGLSLYGIPPWKGAPERGLQPVMTLSAQIVQVARLRAGETIGYGATFKAPVGSPAQGYPYAIIAAGYADGIQRALSNKGLVSIRGRLCPIIGRVSMDLCAVGCPEGTRVGDSAQILGPELDLWEIADTAGTIPYELLTSVSARVQRVYV